jgi:Putative peptidoglycan binding domain
MKRDLAYQDHGADVGLLQAVLNLKQTGVPFLKMDGYYGPFTLERVLAYQRSHFLLPDGLVGPRTRVRLLARETLFVSVSRMPPAAFTFPPDHAAVSLVVRVVLESKWLETHPGEPLTGPALNQILGQALELSLQITGLLAALDIPSDTEAAGEPEQPPEC